MISSESRMREHPHVRFDERRLETEPRRGVRHRLRAKAAGNSYPHPPTATAPVVDSTSRASASARAYSSGVSMSSGRVEPAGGAAARVLRSTQAEEAAMLLQQTPQAIDARRARCVSPRDRGRILLAVTPSRRPPAIRAKILASRTGAAAALLNPTRRA